MPENPFDSHEQVRRVWDFLDTLARRAWDRDAVQQSQKQAVNNAAGALLHELMNATRDIPAHDPPKNGEPPMGQDAGNNSWSQFARRELVDMVVREDVRSVADAFVKATPILRVLETNGHPNYVFRGHRDISWPLLPRKGRALLEAGWEPPSPEEVLTDRRLTRVLPEELAALERFRELWDKNPDVDDLDQLKDLPEEHAEWWFRMQHYDTGDGTRLLDITTSLTSALLFACVNWSTGRVDDSTDGAIYFWAAGTNANVDDFMLRELPDTAEALFNDYPDAPRFILNPPHNERSKAQSGAFYWWPRFWEEPPYGGPHYLRVSADAKHSIVRDLLCMGFGPKDAVRGIQGLRNEQLLRTQVGMPGWQPIDLR